MQTYRVTGPRAVRGHAPGETFAVELDQALEEALILGGHVEIVPPKTFPCEICAAADETREYATTAALKGHMTRQHS